jgi:glycosyltransferase involved in cell wall biosynthesis
MQVIQAVNGAFHHFDLARELERRGYLKRIYSGFPWRRLAREGVSRELVTPLPWLHTALFLGDRYLRIPRALDRSLTYMDFVLFDRWVASRIESCDAFVALSGSGLQSGQLARERGGKYVCDRGSSHIRYQDALLTDEYRRWGLVFAGIDPRMIAREEAEYQAADAITVPSEFARRSFIEMGVAASKVVKIPYGVRLSRFQPSLQPPGDRFEVLFAGTVTLRKGFPYLIQAFQMLQHPRKRLRLAGPIDPRVKPVLDRLDLTNVELLGALPQGKLAECMSGSHVMVLPSIEDGFGLVLTQAMACGCPVIGSLHTGAEDLIQDGVEGFLVPVRSAEAIHDRLAQLAGDPALQARMSAAALARVQSLGGWSDYGEKYSAFLKALTAT